MPSNMYGPRDNYDPNTSHFFPALIKKIVNVKKKNLKSINVWGNGKPKRELLFVDDFADAIIYFLKKKIKEPYINIGSGKDYSIKWYTEFLSKMILGKKIKIIFDKSKPNGTLKKLLDTSIAKVLVPVPKMECNNITRAEC